MTWGKYHLTPGYLPLAKCGPLLCRFNPSSLRGKPIFSHTLLLGFFDPLPRHSGFVATVSMERFRPSCIYPNLLQNQCICLLLGSRCCLTTQVLISCLSPSTHSLAGASQPSLFTHVIHDLPFPFSPDNNCAPLLRNSQLTSLWFLIFPSLYSEVTNYQLCGRQRCVKSAVMDWPLYPPHP